jgi:hypothetical protein
MHHKFQDISLMCGTNNDTSSSMEGKDQSQTNRTDLIISFLIFGLYSTTFLLFFYVMKGKFR